MLKLISVTALILIAPVALHAQTAPNSATATAEPRKSQSGRTDEKICQKQEVTGSRLAKKRVCKTRAEWADHQLQDRQDIERVQTQRGLPGQ